MASGIHSGCILDWAIEIAFEVTKLCCSGWTAKSMQSQKLSFEIGLSVIIFAPPYKRLSLVYSL